MNRRKLKRLMREMVKNRFLKTEENLIQPPDKPTADPVMTELSPSDELINDITAFEEDLPKISQSKLP